MKLISILIISMVGNQLIIIAIHLMEKSIMRWVQIKKTPYNSTFAIGGVSCSADMFVIAEGLVLRMDICAEKPAHRKSANRWWQCELQLTIAERMVPKPSDKSDRKETQDADAYQEHKDRSTIQPQQYGRVPCRSLTRSYSHCIHVPRALDPDEHPSRPQCCLFHILRCYLLNH